MLNVIVTQGVSNDRVRALKRYREKRSLWLERWYLDTPKPRELQRSSNGHQRSALDNVPNHALCLESCGFSIEGLTHRRAKRRVDEQTQ